MTNNQQNISIFKFNISISKMFQGNLLLVLIILIAFALRVYDLGSESLSIDESTSVNLAVRTIPEIIENRAQNNNPPLYFIGLYYWVKVFGTSEYAVRMLSVMFGMLAVAAMFKVGTLFFNKRVGYIATVLLTISVFHVYYAQEARGYALMVFSTLVSMYSFVKLLRRIQPVMVGVYILASVLLMYTHFFGLLLVAAQNLYFLGILLFSKQNYALKFQHWVLIQGLVGLLYLPWIRVLLSQVKTIQGGYWIPQPTLWSIHNTFLTYASNSTPLLLHFLLFCLVAFINHKSDVSPAKKSLRWLLLLWLLMPIVLPYIISQISTPIYYIRYTIAASLAFYLLIAYSIQKIKNIYLSAFIASSIVLYSLFGISDYYTAIDKIPWRDLSTYLSQKVATGDVIFFNPGGLKNNVFQYYFHRDDVEQKSLDLEFDLLTEDTQSIKRLSLDELLGKVKTYDQFWLVVDRNNDTKGQVNRKFDEQYFIVDQRRYQNIELYFFQKTEPQVWALNTVRQTIQYDARQAEEVYLIWGINGWQPTPEWMHLPETNIINGVIQTPMLLEKDLFTADIQVPVGALIDYGFLVMRKQGEDMVEIWDNNQGQDYHSPATPNQSITVQPSPPAAVPVNQDGTLVSQEIHYKFSGDSEIIEINPKPAILANSSGPFSMVSLMLILSLSLFVIGLGTVLVLQRQYLKLSYLQAAFDDDRWLYLRDLLRELVSRDMKLRYKRSVLGILWSLLNPLAQLFVFIFVFKVVLPLDIPNYPLFVFTGLLVWTWFQSALLQATDSIVANPDLIRRPGFPMFLLPVVTITTHLIHFLLAIPILLIFLLWSQSPMTAALLFFPALIVLQFLLTLSLSYLMAALQVTFRDIQHLLGIILTLTFFLTPIFYDAGAIPETYRWLYNLNPVVQLVTAYRAIFLYGEIPSLLPLFIISIASMMLLYISYTVFVRTSYRFVEEL